MNTTSPSITPTPRGLSLLDEVATLYAERGSIAANLTATQERCTELIQEVRALKHEAGVEPRPLAKIAAEVIGFAQAFSDDRGALDCDDLDVMADMYDEDREELRARMVREAGCALRIIEAIDRHEACAIDEVANETIQVSVVRITSDRDGFDAMFIGATG